MRSPPNDFMTIWNSQATGGPTIPLFTVPCRKVVKNQISAVDPPFIHVSGYATFDPPNLITAGIALYLGLRTVTIDCANANFISIQSVPGVFFFPFPVEEVNAHGDHYYRVWLIDATIIP